MSRRPSHRPWLILPRFALPVILTMLLPFPAPGQSIPPNGADFSVPDPALAIDGEVRTSDNAPLPQNTMARLEAEDGRPFDERRVSGDGKFKFVTLAKGAYRLTVTAAGYRPVTESLDNSYGAPPLLLVRLYPVDSTSTPSQSTVTDLAAPKPAQHEYEKGRHQMGLGNLKEAQRHLEKAVEKDPCYARAQTALGMVFTREQQFAAAESAFRKSIKCDGGFLQGFVQLALLEWDQKKYEACSATLEQGLRQFPNQWSLHYDLGKAKQSLSDYPIAEQEYLKAQALNPAMPPAFHLELADLYRKWKKDDKARAEMEAYLRADPNGKFAERTRKMLQDLQASEPASGVPGHEDQRKP